MKCLLLFDCVDTFEVDRTFAAAPRIGEQIELLEDLDLDDDTSGFVVLLRVKAVTWSEDHEGPVLSCDLVSRERSDTNERPKFRGDRHPE